MSKNNKNFFKEKNEWSLIKDKLLGVYLVPYFQKVLMTGKEIIYIDCFAGKGKFEDGNPGSSIIAMDARKHCLDHSLAKIKSIIPYFIELNYAKDLEKNLGDYRKECTVISGKFEEEILKILDCKNEKNIFLYIDPYGIKALSSNLFNSFKKFGFHSFEMLINFNSFGFFRDACRAMSVDYSKDKALTDLEDVVEFEPTIIDSSNQSINLLTEIAGGDYWLNIVNDYKNGKLNGYEAEKKLSAEYKKYLKKNYKYVLDLPIRLKDGQRPKYRMIHVCDHEDGCFLMAQNMQKRKEEVFFNIQQKNGYTVFDFDDSLNIDMEGEIVYLEDIENLVKEQINNICNMQPVSITSFMAKFIIENGVICDFKTVYDILDKLSMSKYISITRIPTRTKTLKPSTFWTEDKDHSLSIRRCT